MREMKDSGIDYIGYIPSEWNVFRNKNAFSCSKRIVGDNSSTTQLLSLTTKGVKEKDINNAEGKLPESFDTYQLVKKNNLIMCLFDLDVSAVFSGISNFDGMISPAYRVLSCHKTINPKYADYWFQYISHGRKFNHYAKNIRYTLNIEEFQALPMIFPPIEEQKRISDYLDSKCSQIDSIIAKQEQIIEKLKEYKLSVITEAVTKGLNPNVEMKDSCEKFIGTIPANWEVRKIKSISDRVVVGVVVRPSEYFDDNGTVPFLRGVNVKEYVLKSENMVYISEDSNKSLGKSVVHAGDILVVRDGAIGVSCIVPDEYDGANVVSMIIIGKDKRFDQRYVCYCLNSLVGKSQFDITRIGSALTHTSVSAVSDISIPYPGVEEQKGIASYLDKKVKSIDKSIDNKIKIIDKLLEYKKSLIFEIVTGKKEV